MTDPLFPYRFSIVCILLGSLIIGVGGLLAVQVERRRAWPTVEGDVVESKWHESAEEAEIRMVVDYQLDGVRYRRTFATDDWQSPEVIPKRYRAGERLRIYYDLEDVDHVLLSPGDHWLNAYAVLFGLLLVALGSLPLIHGLLLWRAKRQLRKAEHEWKAFVTNMEAAKADLDTATGKRGPEYERGLARHQQLAAQADELYRVYRALKQKLHDDSEA